MLTSWLLNPAMLGLGALAIGVPILIHLLNKRRFKIVDWAAMDFLFEADKKNRRRVRLENFILLALRCLAMLLIGILLARPFLPSSITKVINQVQKYERVVLLDDSLSQKVLVGNESALEVAKNSLKQMLTELADSDETEDWFTIFLTSNPTEPLRVNEMVTKSSVNLLNETIDGIQCTDAPADYQSCLQKIKDYVSGERKDVGRVVYVFSDLRVRDWSSTSLQASEFAANKTLQEISEKVPQGFVVDVASDRDQNLAITDFRTEDLLANTKRISFTVEVTNFGDQTVNDVRIIFQVGDEAPKYQNISSIKPGAKSTAEFLHQFTTITNPLSMTDDESELARLKNYRVTAEIDRQSLGEKELLADQLIEDSSRTLAARVMGGIPVLLVDGDPSLSAERSETSSLNLMRIYGSGWQIETVTSTEFETVPLAKYRVIFLCNIDSASNERIRSLEQWVTDGGGLVIMPGNQVDAGTFNQFFHRDGEGLSPLQLAEIEGDSTRNNWVNFEVDPQSHPALRTIVETEGVDFDRLNVFSWWSSILDEEKLGDSVSVPIRLSDADNSVLMTEQIYGKGKSIVFTVPADGDWSSWTAFPQYYVMMVDLVDDLVRTNDSASIASMGSKIQIPVDLSLYQNQVSIIDPSNEKVEKVASPLEDSDSEASDTIYYVTFDDVDRAGFYEVQLNRHSGETDSLLFASNIDPSEGKLQRLNVSSLAPDFFGENFSVIKPENLQEQEVKGITSEIWPWIVVVLLVVLGTEQFLGWFWGRKR